MTTLPRRTILQGAAAAAAFGGQAFAQPRRPYRVGLIGSGWFGKLDLFALMQVAPVEVVALCDVDQRMLEEARDLTRARTDSVTPQRRRPAIHHDYREMLREHEFDIVIIGTPDHWHALQSIAAIEAGAHVYLEKPISVDVREGEAILAAARARNRVVQAGTQRRTAPPFLEARERFVRTGLLGDVGHIEVFCYFHQRPAQFSAPSAPPPNLDWDFYCGPAPAIPFIREMHPRDWRAFEGFGNGYLGDVGVHFIDSARWILGLGAPKRVTSSGGIFVDTQSASTVPDTQMATFEFDDITMTWTNRHWGRAPDPSRDWGAAIHGDKGTLRLYNAGYEFIPVEGPTVASELASELDQFPADQAMLDWERPLAAITRYHMRDFITAIEAGTRPAADIEEAHISTSTCVLANTALKLGRTLNWDGHHVVGDPEADAMMARAYRAPWVHPGV
ncbi:MAG: Gfo/Idh/MocA family oxidoreductase [Terricaulis sp.]